MSDDDDRWRHVVGELLARTEAGAMRSTRWKPTLTQATERASSPHWVAETNGRSVVLHGYQYKYWQEEDTFEWSDGVALDLLDAAGEPAWRVPTFPETWKLLDAVSRQAADADGFARDVLAASKA